MSKLTLLGFVGLFVAAVLLGYFALGYRPAAIRQQPMLPVIFEHMDHKEVACAKCHHNFTDDTGSGTCYSCHKYSPDINLHIEEMFHDFCRDCHLEERHKGEKAGPLRSCAQCHDPKR